jgi:hypothetical protein
VVELAASLIGTDNSLLAPEKIPVLSSREFDI